MGISPWFMWPTPLCGVPHLIDAADALHPRGTPHNSRSHSRASVLRPSPFGGPTMLERLFDCPRVLMRQRAGPLLEERLRYLCHRADQGITRRILQETAVLCSWLPKSCGWPPSWRSHLVERDRATSTPPRPASCPKQTALGPRVRRRRFASMRPAGSASWVGSSHTAILPTPMRRRSLLTATTSAVRRNWLPRASTVSP